MIKRHIFSFKNAFSGVSWILKTQNNFRLQLIFSALAIIGGFIFNISQLEFLLILTIIFVGLAIEAVNTAIEETIDALHKDFSPQIKIAKDVSAAAMLIFSLGALIIAWIIFIPKIVLLFSNLLAGLNFIF